MEDNTQDAMSAMFYDLNAKLVDIDEKQRLLKEKLLLISKNLLDLKQTTSEDLLDLKSSTAEVKEEIGKMKRSIINISSEVDKKARKSEVEVLTKQLRMFQPIKI